MALEEWKPVEGFSYYEVSNLGRLRSLDRQASCGLGRWRVIPGRILSGGLDRDGYVKFNLYKNGKHATRKLHQLVAEHHISPWPEWASEVRHRDGDKTRNEADNLAYATTKENAQDRITHGTQVAKDTHPRAKVSSAQVAEIKALRGKATQKEIGALYGLKQAQVSAIQTGRNWGS